MVSVKNLLKTFIANLNLSISLFYDLYIKKQILNRFVTADFINIYSKATKCSF